MLQYVNLFSLEIKSEFLVISRHVVRPPSYLIVGVTAGLKNSLTKNYLLFQHHAIYSVGSLVHYVQHLSLYHQLQGLLAHSLHRASLRVSGSNAAASVDGCKADGNLHQRYIEDVQHLGTDIEGPQVPQEVQSVLSLLVLHFQSSLSKCTPRYQ